MTIELLEVSATNPTPVAVYKNKNYAPGQMCIHFLFGIGEQAKKKSLKEASQWPPVGQLKGTSLAMAADFFSFNIVASQPRNEYEDGEIQNGKRIALEYLQCDPNQLHLHGHSLGMFGFQREVSKNAEIAKGYASFTSTGSGPGLSQNTGKNIAATGRPMWEFTSATDRNNGTTPEASIALNKAIIDAGGLSWLTNFNNVEHNAIASAIISAWGPGNAPGGWSPVNTTNSTVFNKPGVKSWYEYLFGNILNKQVLTPEGVIIPVKEEPIPVPEPKVVFQLFDNGTWKAV